MQINIEIEPTYLLGIGITLAFGLNYGIMFVLIPGIISAITTGMSGGLLINITNKIIVNIVVFYYWLYFPNVSYLIYISTLVVLVTDLFSFKLRKQMGQPMYEIVQVLATNTIIRFMYFSIFLELIVKFI